MNQDYIDTVRLLLAIAPAVFQSPRFAMKGGMALNLFVQDMPRLSVDIDAQPVELRSDGRSRCRHPLFENRHRARLTPFPL
jgi:hypothetical protein